MDELYFRTSDLSVGYNGKSLIHDINFEIRRGEIVTLIGPNGSGKSTILKSITRQLKLIGGKVWVRDEELEKLDYKTLATRMAVVLTERMKPELMTCRDVVSTGRYPYTGRLGLLTAEDEDKVTAAMERVHALELADRDFDAISDGQRQRVLLARAICQEPEIIVLDEPTSFLDIRHKLELLSILRSMAKEKGITVIMSLHEIDLAQKISDKIMCVKGETIEHFGTPDEIFRPEIINDLYGIREGAFNITFGSVELPRPAGTPKTFVISGCGSGTPVFRRLQKEDKPFYAGILWENDLDRQVAGSLAAEVVTEKPFMPVSDETYDRALALMKTCDTVICTEFPIGETNRRLAELIEEARSRGILRRE